MATLLRPQNTVDPTAASCWPNELDLMFAEDAAGTAAAKKLCTDCPERLACLEGSLLRREPYGTWGGVSQDERRELFRFDRTGRAS